MGSDDGTKVHVTTRAMETASQRSPLAWQMGQDGTRWAVVRANAGPVDIWTHAIGPQAHGQKDFATQDAVVASERDRASPGIAEGASQHVRSQATRLSSPLGGCKYTKSISPYVTRTTTTRAISNPRAAIIYINSRTNGQRSLASQLPEEDELQHVKEL